MSVNRDLLAMAVDKHERELTRKQQERERRQRQQERAERERRRREELLAEIARPFISADLLSDEERAQIRARIDGKERSIGPHHSAIGEGD